ncbi:IclR family transcriptional regulator [Arthrobacter sp. SLBN-122]|uniref:IclR family transcriptional regulator n=1 Tax=Arthrobacter sp. SLBN-122 TaxID=2768455 RepID=UPI0011530B02|nr:IclR family transcriptional regulator C-terminal domain-containing protein [Arthrobacter sp. SLBN-122]TQJ33645.1 IclR family transcriptional regulator [Arthrobacter sp. SLBN-122]
MEEQDPQAPQRDGSKEVVAVLEAVIGRTGYGWGVRELADELGASRSTINRILSRLVEERFVSRDAAGAYILGPRLKVLSKALQKGHPLFTEGSRILSRLSQTSGATALMAVETGKPEECFVLASLEPDAPVRYTLTPGSVVPTHAGALGLAILSRRGTAGLPDELKKYTEASMDSRKRIENALESYASIDAVVSIGQHIPDAAGIAVPFTVSDHLVGSLSLSRPRNEFEESSIAPGAETLRQAAEELEDILRSSQSSVRTPGLPPAESSALIDRITAIITTFCGQPLAKLTLSDLSTLWGTRSVATRRLAESACDAGLMTKPDQRTWTIGPTLLRWSAALGTKHELSEIVDDDLLSLSQQTGETITLALYDAGEKRAYIARSHVGARNVRYVLDEGSEIPLTAGAAGKAILAYLPQTHDAPISDAATIRAEELEGVRTQGWAATDSERVPDAHGIAAPIFINGTVGGSVTATIPNHRVAGTPAEELIAAVVQTALRLSRLLSTDPQSPPAQAEPEPTKSPETRTPMIIAG